MRNFAVHLEQGLPVPLVLWDERLTTKAAEDLLIAADVSRKKRKGAVDRIAAAILLQSYLASREQPSSPASDEDWSREDRTDEASDHPPRSSDRSRRTGHSRVSDH
jgi:putative Holliday junction resolvase